MDSWRRIWGRLGRTSGFPVCQTLNTRPPTWLFHLQANSGLLIRGSSNSFLSYNPQATTEILTMIFAYFTPEVALPVASAVAAVFGFVMLVGRTPVRIAVRGFRWAGRGLRSVVDKFQM